MMKMIRLFLPAFAVVLAVAAFAATDARADGRPLHGGGIQTSESYVLSVSPTHIQLSYGLQPAHYQVYGYRLPPRPLYWHPPFRHRLHHWRHHHRWDRRDGPHDRRDAWDDGGHRAERRGGGQGGRHGH